MPPSRARPKPVNAGLADKIERIRKADPPLSADMFVRVRAFVDEHGLDMHRALDELFEQSALRKYGGMTQDEADEKGWEDAMGILVRQRRMAV